MQELKNFTIKAVFIFNKPVTYLGKENNEHVFEGNNGDQNFEFESSDEFQLIDIVVNSNSVRKHVENSVDYFDFKKPLDKETFNKSQKKLSLEFCETDWICVVGPFSRHKVANKPESGRSDTFYYITWFGHARPGTNIKITGRQIISHNQKILDKWILQKRMWGKVGESRARIFFVPPFEYID